LRRKEEGALRGRLIVGEVGLCVFVECVTKMSIEDHVIATKDGYPLSPPSGVEAVGTGEQMPSRATHLQSKIALLKDVQRWQREIDNTRRKLKKLGRYNIFELEIRDVGKKAMFHIQCEDGGFTTAPPFGVPSRAPPAAAATADALLYFILVFNFIFWG
jgi:hypothetical protein